MSRKKTDGHPLGNFPEHGQCCAIKVGTFKDGNCKVLLPQASDTWICLSGTAYQTEHSFKDKLADLLFAWEKAPDLRISSPVELKGGHVDISDVQKQLQNGADIIAKMLTGIRNVKFAPILVFQTIKTNERRTIRNHRITFRGQKYEITTLKSGGWIASLPW